MRIIDVEQGSFEWLEARAGIPTASEFDALVSPTGKIRTGQTPRSYLARKVAEWWLGGPLPEFGSVAMDYGKVLEEEARPAYALHANVDVRQVGLILSDDGRVGCSPDGLIGDDSGVEIKCPSPQTHTAYLLAGELPDDYVLQVQGSMYVTGFQRWTFVSYCRRFPLFVLSVERDPGIQDVLENALAGFFELFDDAKERWVKRHGPRFIDRPKAAKPEPAIKYPDWLPTEQEQRS